MAVVRVGSAALPRGLLVVVLGLCALGLTAWPAQAFDDHGPLCSDLNSTRLQFSNDAYWNKRVNGGPTFEAEVRDAHRTWRESIPHWRSGQSLYWGGSTWRVSWASISTYSALAVTNCPEKSVTFKRSYEDEYRADTYSLQGIATHEFGHMWGLAHAGRHDSFAYHAG